MKLYHGSTDIIKKPLILDSQRLLDFGKGFYTTTNLEQAQKWALIKQNRMGENAQAYVSEFFIDDKVIELPSFHVKRFKSADEEWLDFVVRNRKENYLHPFDMVIGAVANDTLYKTLTLYETGILTKTETIVRLKIHKLFDQISFHSQKIINHISFVESFHLNTIS